MTRQARILIVDDDPIVAESLADFLSEEGYGTATAWDGSEALNLLHAANRAGSAPDGPSGEPFALVIADQNMPRRNGMDLLKAIRKEHPSVAVIIMTGYARIECAVDAIRAGAIDYLAKPIVDDELRISVGKAIQQHNLLEENRSLRSQLDERFGMDNIVGADYRMQQVYDLVEAVAPSRTTVLIEGESGTGKSMVARAIHQHSDRRSGPFVTFSCGAIPETLLESELFGHVKGAFTSADSDKAGKILAADGGTVFIDEINSATPALQLKLLRVLQERRFEPLGSHQTREVDVRFVLATNQDLHDLVAAGKFREDLFYRINVVNIRLPSMRERIGDLQLLTEHFIDKHCREMNKTITGLADEAMAALQRHDWPGNVRELENAIERAVVLSRKPVIELIDLPETVQTREGGAGATPGQHMIDEGPWVPMPLEKALEGPERRILLAALQANDWNRQETARQLDINRTTLYKKIKRYHLDEPQ